jgi:hypothetical protein
MAPIHYCEAERLLEEAGSHRNLGPRTSKAPVITDVRKLLLVTVSYGNPAGPRVPRAGHLG